MVCLPSKAQGWLMQFALLTDLVKTHPECNDSATSLSATFTPTSIEIERLPMNTRR